MNLFGIYERETRAVRPYTQTIVWGLYRQNHPVFVVSANFLYDKILRSTVWLDLQVKYGLYQNYMVHNDNLTAFSVDSEKQMSDI